jgi:hypothetical protein
MAKKSLEDQIKEMEKNKRDAAPTSSLPVSFDSWFHQRSDKIAKCHYKEIIMADFKARGISEEATVEEFDKALALYGVKL